MGRNKKIRTTFGATRACKKTLEIRKTTKLLALEESFVPVDHRKEIRSGTIYFTNSNLKNRFERIAIL